MENKNKQAIKKFIYVSAFFLLLIYGFNLVDDFTGGNDIKKKITTIFSTNENIEVSIEDKARCQKDGQEFLKNVQGDYEDILEISDDANYIYNAELNTCLIHWDYFYFSTKNIVRSNNITDIYTNTQLATWVRTEENEVITNNMNTASGFALELEKHGFDWTKSF